MFMSDATQISVFMVILGCRRTLFLNARAGFGRVFQSFDDLPRVAEGLGMIVIAAPLLIISFHCFDRPLSARSSIIRTVTGELCQTVPSGLHT
jgi:hypothetical protein